MHDQETPAAADMGSKTHSTKRLKTDALETKKAGRKSFFFNDTATTEIYTLSLHDALPISYFHFHQRTILDEWRQFIPWVD